MKLSDFSSITVRKARTQEDYDNAMRIRHAGYGKYGLSLTDVEESLDRSPQATILIAENGDGCAVGTMRILDRTLGPIELDRYLDLPVLLPATQLLCAEATRLSVPASPLSPSIKCALWKAFHRYCLGFQLTTMLIWARPGGGRDYRMLMFEEVDSSARFAHPVLGGAIHSTFVLNLVTAESRYREAQHPLHEFLFIQKHPRISFL